LNSWNCDRLSDTAGLIMRGWRWVIRLDVLRGAAQDVRSGSAKSRILLQL